MFKSKNNPATGPKPTITDVNLLSNKSSNSRILKTNLVYIIGLTKEIANVKILNKPEFFGQYGKIISLVINYKPLKPKDCEEYYAAYITFSTPEEASLAILAVDNTMIDKNHCIRATFGNTKYCENFLKKKKCTIKDCLFVHSNSAQEVIVERDELNKVSYRDLRQKAAKIANIFDIEVRSRLMRAEKVKEAYLPHVSSIYTKPPIYSNDPLYYEIQESNNNYKNIINGGGLIQSNDKSENASKAGNNLKGVNGLKDLLGNKPDTKFEEGLTALICDNDLENFAKADTEQTEGVVTKTKSCSEDYGSSEDVYKDLKDLSGDDLITENEVKVSGGSVSYSSGQGPEKPIKRSLSSLLLLSKERQSFLNENNEFREEVGDANPEIPEIIVRIMKNRNKNIKIDNQNKYSKICSLLRSQILKFSAEGIGSSESESKWAKHLLDNESNREI